MAGERTFAQRVAEAASASSAVCVGIDPHPPLLDAWGLDRTPAGLERFGLSVVEAAAGRVAIVKPQVSFFEQYGSRGFAALERVMAVARDAGLLVIADAKRGDIGSTNAGYADAWLARDAPLACDALTVSPYLGAASLDGLVETARSNGRGVFVLAATSNPEAASTQLARVADGRTLAASIVSYAGAQGGAAGVVIGATLRMEERGIDPASFPTGVPILAPGFGAQGASLERLGELYGALAPQVIPNVSRSVLAGPASGLGKRIDDAVRQAALPRP